MKFKKYTHKQMLDAIASSMSIRQVLLKLGLADKGGGNYKTVYDFIKLYNVDISHFKGKGWSKGKIRGPARKIEVYLTNQKTIGSSELRRRLIREKILLPECAICHLTTWQGKPISLELDHIDGDHLNNNLSNLRILCSNCHAQTETYCRSMNSRKKQKNSKTSGKEIKTPNEQIHKCLICNVKLSTNNSTYCKPCYNKHRKKLQAPFDRKMKIEWPTIEELLERLKTTSYVALGKELGVSDNAIRKHIKTR